jgi:ABC-type cobalamin/Fe3+-siderophores transport system ATPase subunit
MDNIKLFTSGATWLRADFHLHTKADKEFTYNGDPNYFVHNYIKHLKSTDVNINVGVITNHNKFGQKEFNEIRKAAKKEEIYILPGVEFSCREGATGIHILIVFDYSWIDNKEYRDYINDFLVTAFAGITNCDIPPYPNSRFDLKETVRELDGFKKDYFIVLAHPDDPNGIFNELKGRNLEDLINSEEFLHKVLGLQESRSIDNRNKLEKILGNKKIAYLEGTDCAHKGIEGIGRGNEIKGITQKTYVKLGAFDFDALKVALIDNDFRIANELPTIKNGYVKSVAFNGKKLDSTIYLNHSMNNLIGIRGSGKSSILESVRYALDIILDEIHNEDCQYKNDLINITLGSGGKLILELIDDQGNEYRAEKILNESTKIYKNEVLQYGLRPSAILRKTIYFGQNDLSKIGDSLSTEFLINKLIGEHLDEHKRLIESKNHEIIALLSEIKNIEKNIETRSDVEAKKSDIENKISKFKEYKIDQKLDEQIEFDRDANQIKRLKNFQQHLLKSTEEYLNEYKDGFTNLIKYESKQNAELFSRFFESFNAFQILFKQIEEIKNKLDKEFQNFTNLENQFQKKYDDLKEKFAEIKRQIKLPNIQAEDYVKFTKDLDLTNSQLREIEKLEKRKDSLNKKLRKSLSELQELWNVEYKIIKDEVDIINKEQSSIKIDVNFKANKESFRTYLKDNLKGSGLRDNNIKNIVDGYNDLIEVFYDIDLNKSKLNDCFSGDTQLLSFREFFNSRLTAFLTYRVPDNFEIIYRNRPLSEHSLGQRASALIIFLLTLKDSDLIIIDQPEDDLDNQTIYDDVIKVLRRLKNETQFIFATHNPNIPVLGDCEQIISCHFQEDKLQITQGSIDNGEIRDEIVNIMEGGNEAFNERKRIYELWKH